MNVYGELISAQLENRTTDYAPGAQTPGRAWYRTDVSQVKVDTGSIVSAFLLNDQHMVMGTNATANNNVRWNRSANGKVQLVLGGDTTAEGTDSANLAQLSFALEQYATGSLPTAASSRKGQLVLDITANSPKFCTGTGWSTLGSGSGGSKNYLSSYKGNPGNGDLELGVVSPGWSACQVTYSSNTPSGAPGSDTAGNVTLGINSATPLAGNDSLQVILSASAVVGEGFISDAFTIDTEDQAEVMAWSFFYKVGTLGGNYSGTNANTFSIWIYDVTNSAWLQPAGVYNMVQSSGVGKATGTFQTSSNGTQYRIAVLVNSVSGIAGGNITFDDFVLGPQSTVNAPAMSDWTQFTMVITSTGTTPAKGTNSWDKAFWRRVGDSMQIKYELRQTGAGTAGTGVYLFALPPGYSIDTTKHALTSGNNGEDTVGSAAGTDSSHTYTGQVQAYDSTHLELLLLNNASTFVNVGSSACSLGDASTSVSFIATVPISGWSSSTVSSADTDTRVVAFAANGAATNAGAGSPIIWPTVIKDTHSAYNSTTGQYTIQVTGWYRFSASFWCSASVASKIVIYKGGVSTGVMITAVSTGGIGGGSIEAYFNAGDVITIVSADGQLTSVNANSTLSISRISGPAVVQATESVSAKYYLNAASTTSSTTAPINFDTKVWDSHNAVTTGASWQFKAPVSGKYRVSTYCNVVSGTQATYVDLYKNGSAYEDFIYSSNVSTNLLFGSTIVSLLAGEYIDLRCTTSTIIKGGGQPVGAHIEIERIGN